MVVTIICPGCEAPLQVVLTGPNLRGTCEFCGTHIEVVGGDYYESDEDDFDPEEFEPW